MWRFPYGTSIRYSVSQSCGCAHGRSRTTGRSAQPAGSQFYCAKRGEQYEHWRRLLLADTHWCSLPRVLFLASTTRSVSSSASCPRPASLYLITRSFIELRVIGCSSPSVLLYTSTRLAPSALVLFFLSTASLKLMARLYIELRVSGCSSPIVFSPCFHHSLYQLQCFSSFTYFAKVDSDIMY